jgi:TPR repeat protein
MNKFLYLSFIFGILSAPALAQSESAATPTTIDYFSYSSERCKDIKDGAELYQIAISLRDSKDAKDQIDAVDCMVGAAFRSYGAAEYELARMYSVGSIVPQSNIFAYRWAELAVMDGYPDAKELRDRLEAELSANELETAMDQAKKVYQERLVETPGRYGSSSRTTTRNRNRTSRR